MGELTRHRSFTFHDGKVDELKRLSALCLEIVRAKDTGTLQYETTSTTTSGVHRPGAIPRLPGAHRARRAPRASHEAYIATGDVHGELLGDPSAALRANFGPTAGPALQLYQALYHRYDRSR